jgi:hypothetical protein
VDALSFAEKYASENGLVNLVLLSHASGGNQRLKARLKIRFFFIITAPTYS